MAEEIAIEAVAREEDIDAVSGRDDVDVRDVGIVREEIVGATGTEEVGDVGEVVIGGEVVGSQGEIAACLAGRFRSSEEEPSDN